MLWLLLGLVAVFIVMAGIAPELLGAPSAASGLALVAVAAGLPGLVVVVVLFARRSRSAPRPGRRDEVR